MQCSCCEESRCKVQTIAVDQWHLKSCWAIRKLNVPDLRYADALTRSALSLYGLVCSFCEQISTRRSNSRCLCKNSKRSGPVRACLTSSCLEGFDWGFFPCCLSGTPECMSEAYVAGITAAQIHVEIPGSGTWRAYCRCVR